MSNTNTNLNKAKQAKNDEFFTRYEDIEKEIQCYIDYNPAVFNDKTIMCPCDDFEKSNFTKYFVENFDKFGLKKLICTSYKSENDYYGKYYVQTKDETDYGYLQGDGDFRSEEVTTLKDESDIIVTNPPFSLFREFFDWEIPDKDIITLGSLIAVKYSNIFPYTMNYDVWFGNNVVRYFETDTGIMQSGCRWYTNIPLAKESKRPDLHTMEYNLKYSKHNIIREKGYIKYDNYDAIEIPYIDAIPSDYKDIMGVPITFFDSYLPDYEILGMNDSTNKYGLKIKQYDTNSIKQYRASNGKPVVKIDGEYKQIFDRIFIKKRQNNVQ